MVHSEGGGKLIHEEKKTEIVNLMTLSLSGLLTWAPLFLFSLILIYLSQHSSLTAIGQSLLSLIGFY
jgi:hypothetical protein